MRGHKRTLASEIKTQMRAQPLNGTDAVGKLSLRNCEGTRGGKCVDCVSTRGGYSATRYNLSN